jgi:acetylornithine deacetylase/succinyl-diaminopimelate desuccinylase-like protein
MQAAGIPTVLLGPARGNFHARDEWVPIPEVTSLAQILVEAIGTFCG